MSLTEPGRKSLTHDPPHFIGTADAVFFITICCKPRGDNQFCNPTIAQTIFETARHYHQLHYWSLPLLLLMPDHLHMLARFGAGFGMKDIVRNWKRFVAAKHGIHWQRAFFDHRLRGDESEADKAFYIMENPARAGLVQRSGDWPYHTSVV